MKQKKNKKIQEAIMLKLLETGTCPRCGYRNVYSPIITHDCCKRCAYPSGYFDDDYGSKSRAYG